MARKIILSLGVLLLLIGGLVWWRATHPALTDEEQIAANLEGLRTSAESGSVGGVMNYLAEDFTWGGRKRSEVSGLLYGAFYEGLRKRDFRLTFTNVRPVVQGATATATGHFKVDVRTFRGAVDTPASGEFSTTWEKRDGQWKITRASGGENVQ